MNTVLWILQGALTILFLYSGSMKSTRSEHWLVTHNQTGVEGLPILLTRFIGIMEITGCIALVLPGALGIATMLTPIAALCFALIMAMAAPIHYKRHEPQSIMLNIVVLILCLFVAWGRWKGI